MFTYCLVTKGRKDYLPNALASLTVALQSEDVQVIIVDNGCPADSSEILRKWCEVAGSNAHYVRFDVNDFAAPRIWSALKNFKIEWISFPGDDDVVRSEVLNSARSLIKQNGNLTAIAASMRIIDSIGNPSGLLRYPREQTGDRVHYFATSLHEPPFLFPALFIKFSAISVPILNSRYVFDWWISLNLICLGDIVTIKEIALDYRVHQGQESAVAPSRRKFFEAQIMLSRFIQSEEFENFLVNITDVEKYNFWKSITLNGPVYGDSEFGSAIQLHLLLILSKSIQDAKLSADLIGMYAAHRGTFLREGEVRGLLGIEYPPSSSLAPNFRLTAAEGSCDVVLRLVEFEITPNDSAPSFLIGCTHTKSIAKFNLDCELNHDSAQNALDTLILKITNQLEYQGVFDFKITPVERKVILNLRRVKNKLPMKFFKFLRETFESSGK
jgi:hypothetical protein